MIFVNGYQKVGDALHFGDFARQFRLEADQEVEAQLLPDWIKRRR